MRKCITATVGRVKVEFYGKGEAYYSASGSPDEIILAGIAKPSRRRSGICPGFFDIHSGKSHAHGLARDFIERDKKFRAAIQSVLGGDRLPDFSLPAPKARRSKKSIAGQTPRQFDTTDLAVESVRAVCAAVHADDEQYQVALANLLKFLTDQRKTRWGGQEEGLQ